MKTTLALAVALLVSAGTAHAQTSFGVKAGINLANLSIDDADDTFDPENRTGFVAGVFVTVRGGGVFAFQPEVLFSQQGAKFSDGRRLRQSEDRLLPGAAARAHWTVERRGVVVGPSFGFRTARSCRATGLSARMRTSRIRSKRMDFGLVAGVTATSARWCSTDATPGA